MNGTRFLMYKNIKYTKFEIVEKKKRSNNNRKNIFFIVGN